MRHQTKIKSTSAWSIFKSKARIITGSSILAAVTCLTWSENVFAHSSLSPEEAHDLQTLTEEANLVVHGTVVAVNYINTKTNGEEVPFTRVTYQLQKTFRGEFNGDKLTLQFVGGADGKGGFLFVSGVPTFQKSDEDILFIRGNGEDGVCPLVHCEYGRFRLHHARVYNTHGQPLLGMDGNRTIARGERAPRFQTLKYPTPKFDDLITTDEAKAILKERGISLETARTQYLKMAPKEIEVTLREPEATKTEDNGMPNLEGKKLESEANLNRGVPNEKSAGADPLPMESLLAMIEDLERSARRQPTRVADIPPSAPIRPRGASAASPGNPPSIEVPAKQVNAEDEAEAEALESQEFNPVLKPKGPRDSKAIR